MVASVIQCGFQDNGHRNYKRYSEFFGAEVDVFVAEKDEARQFLYRLEDVERKLCPVEPLKDYIQLYAQEMEGIYCATGFSHRLIGTRGLHQGTIFLSEVACKFLEKKILRKRGRDEVQELLLLSPKKLKLQLDHVDDFIANLFSHPQEERRRPQRREKKSDSAVENLIGLEISPEIVEFNFSEEKISDKDLLREILQFPDPIGEIPELPDLPLSFYLDKVEVAQRSEDNHREEVLDSEPTSSSEAILVESSTDSTSKDEEEDFSLIEDFQEMECSYFPTVTTVLDEIRMEFPSLFSGVLKDNYEYLDDNLELNRFRSNQGGTETVSY